MIKDVLNRIFKAKECLNLIDFSNILIEVDEDLRKKIQKELLLMYKDVIYICTKYNIVPFLAGGSALGAVRHKGFIPWDDDLDIAMTRKDYQIFTKIFDKELSDKYYLCAPNYSKKVKSRFPKIIKKGTLYKEATDADDDTINGLFLDIFIVEGVPNNKLHRKIKGNYCNVLMFIAGQVALYENREGLAKEIYMRMGKMNYYMRIGIGFLFSFHSSSRWFEKVDRNVRYNCNRTKQVGLPTGRKHYFGEILDKDKLFPAQYVEFEDIEAPVFKDIDYYLFNLYGDYMKIPPREKREKHFLVEIDL